MSGGLHEYLAAMVLALMATQVWVFVCLVALNYWLGLLRRSFSLSVLEHLHALTRLGLPLTQGFRRCEEAGLSRGSVEDIRSIEEGLQQGWLVGDALERVSRRRNIWQHLVRRLTPSASRRLVSPAEAEVLRVGERSGNLADAVRLVLTERRRHDNIRASLLAVSFYPAALVVVFGGILAGLVTFVIPKFKKMFEEMDLGLPPLTRALLAAADTVGTYWFPALLALLAMGAVAALARQRASGAGALSSLMDRVPGLHRSVRRVQLAEFCHELAMLLRAGTPTHQALGVIAEGAVHPWVRRRAARAAELTAQGRTLGQALDETGLDRRAAWFGHALADRTDIADALSRLGDDYAESVSWTAAVSARLIPPLLVLIVGSCAAWVAVGVFLPLVKLMGGIGG